MRRLAARLLATASACALLLLVAAPVALATTNYGQGTYGETNDQVVTNAGFILIAFFPLFIFFASLLQWRLDKRKEARKAAAKRRRANTQWQGGW